MKDFAKIFNSEKFGQIVVMNTTNDESLPCVSFTYQVEHDEIGEITTRLTFKDGDEKKCDDAFDVINIEMCDEHIQAIYKHLNIELINS